MAKELKDAMMFEHDKKMEKHEQKLLQLREIKDLKKTKEEKLRAKFLQMETGAKQVNDSLIVFKQCMREQNMYKQMDN